MFRVLNKNMQRQTYSSPNIKVVQYNFLGVDPLNPIFSRSITIDTLKYKTISDIHPLIASDLHVKEAELIIEKPEPAQLLQNLPPNYTIQINIKNFCPDLDFYLPNGQIIQIKNGFKMNLNQIYKSLINEVSYYSPNCIRTNFCFTVSGKKLTDTDFPFYSSRKNTKIIVELQGQIVTIKYGEFEFTFSENENYNQAFSFLTRSFNNISNLNGMNYNRRNNRRMPTSNVSILNEQYRIISNQNEVLKSFMNYTIQVNCNFSFSHKLNGNAISICIDYLSTVFDAQKQLAIQMYNYNYNTNPDYTDIPPPSIYYYEDDEMPDNLYKNRINNANSDLKPENFIIYDKDKNEINDLNKQLIKIQDINQCFYYEITFDITKMKKPEPKKETITKSIHIKPVKKELMKSDESSDDEPKSKSKSKVKKKHMESDESSDDEPKSKAKKKRMKSDESSDDELKSKAKKKRMESDESSDDEPKSKSKAKKKRMESAESSDDEPKSKAKKKRIESDESSDDEPKSKAKKKRIESDESSDDEPKSKAKKKRIESDESSDDEPKSKAKSKAKKKRMESDELSDDEPKSKAKKKRMESDESSDDEPKSKAKKKRMESDESSDDEPKPKAKSKAKKKRMESDESSDDEPKSKSKAKAKKKLMSSDDSSDDLPKPVVKKKIEKTKPKSKAKKKNLNSDDSSNSETKAKNNITKSDDSSDNETKEKKKILSSDDSSDDLLKAKEIKDVIKSSDSRKKETFNNKKLVFTKTETDIELNNSKNLTKSGKRKRIKAPITTPVVYDDDDN